MSKRQLDIIIMEKVKKIREGKDIGPKQLSLGAGYYGELVNHVENSERKEKYNLYHLNDFAKFMKCSVKDFLTDDPI
ncbi:hypothetical protein [Chitinophaga pinensis]|uniref:Uncharacterized protein n=1 Tax=Chitinophaga pinensis (strain ATCC 43595 / DSM 2588 / LMG 13176 / NBRC 15968 / NCIMB 11800 / UQM 2034) TaxID=485918 RepID=A0A979GQ09_CHIPD|nr:hypothetical protein [Chitinophaga pinensis]ACU60982.1 hypothetical protein Cpin_3518 [Chitinophaga pinensis DSM 2588]